MSLFRSVVFGCKPMRLPAGLHLPSAAVSTLSKTSHSTLSTPKTSPRAYQKGYPTSPRLFSSPSYNRLQASENSSSSSAAQQRLTFSPDTLLITDSGKKRLKEILSDDSSNSSTYLRISVEGGGCSGFQYKFEMDSKTPDSAEDIILTESGEVDPGKGEAVVVIDKTSLDILKGATLDYEVELIRSAFRVINIPAAEQGCSCGASFNVKID